MQYINFGGLKVSRFVLGSNPFSAYSHLGLDMDVKMMHYFTTARIKAILRECEALGINTMVGRADHHIMRVLLEYWDEGGTIQWFSQTCPGVGSQQQGVENAAMGKAVACAMHGGHVDYLFANGKMSEVVDTLKLIRDKGMLVGMASHRPDVIRYAEEHLDLDYYMCSYYNPFSRDKHPEHIRGSKEWFYEDDRRRMAETISGLSRQAIHYKVMAAGRNDPEEAFRFVGQALRTNDVVCVGIYNAENPDMLADDVRLFDSGLESARR